MTCSFVLLLSLLVWPLLFIYKFQESAFCLLIRSVSGLHPLPLVSQKTGFCKQCIALLLFIAFQNRYTLLYKYVLWSTVCSQHAICLLHIIDRTCGVGNNNLDVLTLLFALQWSCSDLLHYEFFLSSNIYAGRNFACFLSYILSADAVYFIICSNHIVMANAFNTSRVH